MPMLRSHFPKSLEAGLNAVWMANEKQMPMDWPKLFESKTSNRAFEEQVVRAGLGIAPIKAEGNAFVEDMGGEFWTQRYLTVTIGLMFSLTQEALEDNLYKDLGATYTASLQRAITESEEIMAANVLNTATTANGGDGTTLLSTSHPLWGGGSYANKLSTAADLSEGALEDVLTMISNAVDDRNNPMPLNPRNLVIGNSNVFNAHRIMNTVQRVGTADNDINAIKSMGLFPGEPIAMRRMTDLDQWFVKTDAVMGLQFFRRIALQKGGEEDFRTGNFMYKARTRFAVGYTNPRCLFGSEGA